MLDESETNVDAQVWGVDLLEGSWEGLGPGTILFVLNSSDTVGDNLLSVTESDVIAFDVAATTLGGGPASVTASLVADVSEAGFGTKQWDALAALGADLPPVFGQDLLDRSDDENDVISITAGAVDPDGGPTTHMAVGLPPGLALDSVTGVISGTIDFSAASGSPYATTITATDIAGNTATDSFSWTVVDVNRPPAVTSAGPQSFVEGDAVSFTVTASDPDGDSFTWTATDLPPGVTIDVTSGLVSGTVATGASAASPYSSSIVATDDGTPPQAGAAVVAWTITPPQPPVFDQDLGDRTDAEGDVVAISAPATDPEGGAIAYSAAGLPPGVVIDPITGEVGGTIQYTAAAASPYAVTLTATDPTGLVATDVFSWTVSNTPVDLVIGKTSSATAPLNPGDPITYVLTVENASGVRQTGVDVSDPLPAGTAASVGSTVVAVPATVRDDFDTAGSYAGTNGFLPWAGIWVENDGGPPTAGPDRVVDAPACAVSPCLRFGGGDISVEDVQRSVDLSGHSTATLTFDYRREAADASAPSVAVQVSGNGLGWTSLDKYFLDADDASHQTASFDISAYLAADTAIRFLGDGDATGGYLYVDNIAILTGETLAVVGNDPAVLVADYELHDGEMITISYGVVVDDPVAVGSIVNTATVTSDQLPGGSQVSVTDDVNDAPVFDQDLVDRVTAEGAAVSFSSAATDAEGAVSYAATGLPSAITINPTTGQVSGTVDFDASVGSPYSTEITVTDAGGRTATDTFTWTITDTNRPPVATDPGPQTSAEGDSVTLTLTGSDPDGDGITWTASGLPPGLAIDTGGNVSGTIDYSAAPSSPFSVVFTATDDGTPSESGAVVVSWSVSDTNRPPVLSDPGPAFSAEGDTVSLSIAGSDPDGDGLTWTASGLPPGLAIDQGSGVVSGTIDFSAAPGSPYSVTVTATDDGTPVEEASVGFQWAVSNTNRAPVVTSPGDQVGSEGDPVSVTVAGSDPDGDTITWSAAGLPDGLSIEPATGAISGAIGYDAAASSPFTVVVTATDNGAPLQSDSVSFAWVVADTNRAPIVATPSDQASGEGDALTLTVVGTDPDANT